MPDPDQTVTLPARWQCASVRAVSRSNAFEVESELEIEFNTGDSYLIFVSTDKAFIGRFVIGDHYTISIHKDTDTTMACTP